MWSGVRRSDLEGTAHPAMAILVISEQHDVRSRVLQCKVPGPYAVCERTGKRRLNRQERAYCRKTDVRDFGMENSRRCAVPGPGQRIAKSPVSSEDERARLSG